VSVVLVGAPGGHLLAMRKLSVQHYPEWLVTHHLATNRSTEKRDQLEKK
jgi:hypothetical protein